MVNNKAAQSERNKLILVCVLSAVLGFILLRPSPASNTPRTLVFDAEAANPVPVTETGSPSAFVWEAPPPVPDSLADPMFFTVPEPLVEAEAPQEEQSPAGGRKDAPKKAELKVAGIVYSDKHPAVIIDGEILNEGATLGRATIVTIAKDHVEFEEDGRRWSLPVWIDGDASSSQTPHTGGTEK